jgi:fatty-acyl-CoA synthase
MQGYFERPDLTAAVIDREGWLHTGDAGSVDEDGFFHFTSRLKDIIIRGGENISPDEVENAVAEHEDVLDAKVYGVPDRIMGEEVAASIILRPGSRLTEEELRRHLEEHLARFKIPRYIEFVSSYPMTHSGKVRVSELREAMRKKLLP